MSTAKLNLFVRVYKRRLDAGESVKEIDDSYPALSDEEKTEIHNVVCPDDN